MTTDEILKLITEQEVKYIRMLFTDLNGILKNVEVPANQIERILAGKVTFDGSSIDGFVRILESDMLLKPDLDSFRIFPWENGHRGKVAGFFCDIYKPNGQPFEGDSRRVLKETVKNMQESGFSSFNIGFEPEFYLFPLDDKGDAIVEAMDDGGYFDLAPVDTGVECRREIIHELMEAGFEIEAGHHEVGPGQHEVNFLYKDVVSACDNVQLFKMIVRNVARRFNLHATFMPKPIRGIAGSGMHTNMSLFRSENDNAFYDSNGKMQLSPTAYYFIGGVLRRIREITAVTNPIVNSYKRLVSGFEAPVYIAYSDHNRSALIRIPASRGLGTRCELRMVDPSTNPYLALALILSAGLEGVREQLDPGEPTRKDIFQMSLDERKLANIENVPESLKEAIEEFSQSEFSKAILGKHLFDKFILSRLTEWHDYRQEVHAWEIKRYINRF